MKRIALALASTLAFAALISAAHAVEFTQVQADKSAVNFIYKQMGVVFEHPELRPGQADGRQSQL